MIRKAIIGILILAAVATVAVEVLSKAQSCPMRTSVRLRLPCPVRVSLGRSLENGSYGFIYAVSTSWYSSVGYLRLYGQLDGAFNEEGEPWFHGICVSPMLQPGGRIARVVRVDDIPPSHVFLRALVIPRGFSFLIFAGYPTIAFIRGPLRRWRRRRRRERGLCLDCGYNLTGNESGVCSECGERIEEP